MNSIPIFSQSPTLTVYLSVVQNQWIKSMTELRIIDRLRFHSSNQNIQRNYKITSKFSFKPISKEVVKHIVNDLSSNKAAGGHLPLKILIECDFFIHFLTNCIKKVIRTTSLVPVHKEKDPTDITNYRPVSIIPLLSKVFEKVMYI